MTGPFETAAQARELPAVRAIYDAAHASNRRDVIGEENYLMLFRACEAAGVDLGGPSSYDRRILSWLANGEPETCAVVGMLIIRAAAVRPEPEGGKLAAIRGVLEAFDWQSDDRQLALERIAEIAEADR